MQNASKTPRQRCKEEKKKENRQIVHGAGEKNPATRKEREGIWRATTEDVLNRLDHLSPPMIFLKLFLTWRLKWSAPLSLDVVDEEEADSKLKLLGRRLPEERDGPAVVLDADDQLPALLPAPPRPT